LVAALSHMILYNYCTFISNDKAFAGAFCIVTVAIPVASSSWVAIRGGAEAETNDCRQTSRDDLVVNKAAARIMTIKPMVMFRLVPNQHALIVNLCTVTYAVLHSLMSQSFMPCCQDVIMSHKIRTTSFSVSKFEILKRHHSGNHDVRLDT
jgi:hypothetical protein